MHFYFDRDAEAFDTPQQYADDHECDEGEEFTLIATEVLGANTYRIIEGVPTLIAIAQPKGTEQL